MEAGWQITNKDIEIVSWMCDWKRVCLMGQVARV